MKEKKIKTSIRKLDEILKGGIKKGSSACILCEADTPYRVFIGQIAGSFADSGEKVIFFCTDMPPVSWQGISERYSLCRKCTDNIVMVDAHSYKVGKRPEHKYHIKSGDEREFVDVVKKIINDGYKIGAVFVSLSELEDRFGLDRAFQILRIIREKINTTTIVSHAIEWIRDEKYEKKIMNEFDCIIVIRNLKLRYVLLPYFQVLKARWVKDLDKHKITFRIGLGGVKPFIPKILVTGPFNAGKSSFIKSVSEKSAHADELLTTVAMDFGKRTLDDLEIHFYGTPGQERFDPILKELGSSALGAIVVVDSTDPESFDRAVEMIKKCELRTQEHFIPVIVAANKQNLKSALSIKEIKDKFEKKGVSTEVMSVSASEGWPKKGYNYCLLKKEDVENVIERLMKKIHSSEEVAQETGKKRG